MQIRAMEKYGAPLKAIVPGKCFRNEATDARHEHTFYHIEGIMIDEDINFANLKGVYLEKLATLEKRCSLGSTTLDHFDGQREQTNQQDSHNHETHDEPTGGLGRLSA